MLARTAAVVLRHRSVSSLRATTLPCPLSTTARLYSTTRPVKDKKKDQDFGDVEMINSTLSPEEAAKILQEEYQKFEDEEKAKQYPDWKPGERKRPLQVSYRLEDFEYELDENAERRWTLRDKRCGALAIKVGMMPVWDDWGERHPCTVLYLDRNIVLGHKTVEKHGYWAVQLAAGERKRKNVSSTVLGQYQAVEDLPDQPPYLVREFRVTDKRCLPPTGMSIHARHFVPGQNVDIAGISKGKGFQGAMKRHGFKGNAATHGTSKSHRALGSTGQCQDPGKVFKGKKMAGRMGTDRVTVQNVRVIKIDRGRNLLYVRGAIPGNKGGFVEIRDAVKKPLFGTDKVEESIATPPLPTYNEVNQEVDGCGEAGHEVFMPLPQRDPLSPEDDEAAA